MEASSPSTSRSQPFQFPVSAPTTRQAAARGTRNHGSDGTTLEALHVASRRSRRTRSERAAVVSDVSEGRTRCTRTRKRQAIAEETVAGCSPNPAPRKRVRAKPANLKKPPPLVSGDDAEIKKPACAETCCICMCGVESEDLAGISGCEHRFCFGCIEKWAERENSCPLCKNRFTKIDRINKKRKKGLKNTKKVKQKDQRSDLAPGAALEGLLANFASRNQPSIARLIFSGIGNLDYSFHGPSRSFRDHTVARGSDDDSDDEESPLSSFIRAFHSHQNMPLMGVVQPVTFTARMTSSRSYASNSNDRTAGRGAENPLTIEDSDDEEEVHVYSPSS